MSDLPQRPSLRLHFPGYQLELEIKFLTDQATIKAVLADIERGAPFIPAPIERDERTNTYYDTKGFALYSKAFECRGRETGGKKYKYDLKTPRNIRKPDGMPDADGIFARREYSDDGTGQTPQLALFNKGALGAVLKKDFEKQLLPLVHGQFRRKRFTFSPTGHPDSAVEIAFEEGHFETIDHAHKSEPLYLIELELKSGQRAALVDAAQALQNRYGLTVYDRTKGDMGLSFAATFMDEKKQGKLAAAAARRPANPQCPPPAPQD